MYWTRDWSVKPNPWFAEYKMNNAKMCELHTASNISWVQIVLLQRKHCYGTYLKKNAWVARLYLM